MNRNNGLTMYIKNIYFMVCELYLKLMQDYIVLIFDVLYSFLWLHLLYSGDEHFEQYLTSVVSE